MAKLSVCVCVSTFIFLQKGPRTHAHNICRRVFIAGIISRVGAGGAWPKVRGIQQRKASRLWSTEWIFDQRLLSLKRVSNSQY